MKYFNFLKEPILLILEGIIRNIGGQIGKWIRRSYYRSRLGACGKDLDIGIGVVIQNPKKVFLGNYICLDDYCQLLAGIPKPSERTTIISNSFFLKVPGEIHIGNYSHIGIFSIIQGLGGVEIGDYFTSSPSCRIYSLSNDYKKSRSGTIKNSYYYSSPIKVGNNVWLGMNTIITKGTIGNDCFIKPNNVITGNIPSNSIIESFPKNEYKHRFSD